MKLLMIGGSSCIGKNLIESAPKNWQIKASFCSSKSFKNFILNYPNTEAFHLDLRKNNKELKLGVYDTVLYLSGVPPGRTSDDIPFQIHALGVNTIINAVESCRHFIYLSSGVVYLKDNNSPYRISRTIGEANVIGNALQKKFNYIILRNMEIYGKYMAIHKIYRKLAESCIKGDSDFTITGDGENFLDTMHIRDYISGLVKVIESKVENEIVDFCKSKPVTLKKLSKTIAQVFHRNDFRLICSGGRPTEDTRLVLDNKKMKKIFNFHPQIDLDEGLNIWKDEGLV